jgi:hypothetical protein
VADAVARTDTPTSRASGKEPLFERALNSRVIIEQARGVLAEPGEMAMDDEFRRLRGYARDTNALLARVARDVVDRRVDPNLVLAERPVAGSAAQPDASWVRTFTARQARTRSAGPALTRYEHRTGRSTRARPGPW